MRSAGWIRKTFVRFLNLYINSIHLQFGKRKMWLYERQTLIGLWKPKLCRWVWILNFKFLLPSLPPMFQFKFTMHSLQYGKSHFTKIESRAKSFAVCGNFDQKLDCLCVWMRPQSHLRIHHRSIGKNSTLELKPKTRIWKIGDILPRAYLACLFEWKLVTQFASFSLIVWDTKVCL